MIEPWMIDEKRIAHFKNVFSAAERGYESGRERMISYVVKHLDNRRDAVLNDIQEMIKLIESLILERQELVSENEKLVSLQKTITEMVGADLLRQNIQEQLKQDAKKYRMQQEEKQQAEKADIEGYAYDGPDTNNSEFAVEEKRINSERSQEMTIKGRIKLELYSRPNTVQCFDLSDFRVEKDKLICAIGRFPIADVKVVSVSTQRESDDRPRL